MTDRKNWVNRQSPTEDLDFYPTPPWAARAFVNEVLIPAHFDGHFPLPAGSNRKPLLLEPCCGAGDMMKPLQEELGDLFTYKATDIQDLGYDKMDGVCDFRDHNDLPDSGAWIMTNPPFNLVHEFFEHFVPQIYELDGFSMVAVFVRLMIQESKRRHEFYSRYMPTLCTPYAERVPLVKGRLDQNASSTMAYCWLVWTNRPLDTSGIVGDFGTQLIRPCRNEYEKDSDYL